MQVAARVPALLLFASLVTLAAATSGSQPPFVDAAETTGLKFTHVNGATGQYYMPEVMGSGGALFDYDNDGDLDAYLVQGGSLTGNGSAANGPAGRLFRNDLKPGPGNAKTLRFTDVTATSGLAPQGYGMGTAVGDYDGDGDLDLFVTTFGEDVLYRNEGEGKFTDITRAAGVSDPLWSSSAVFFDADRDGDLDLFVANYLDFTPAGNKQCFDPTGARDYCTPRAFRPVPDRFYRNEGGRFVDASAAAGITRADGAGLGVTAGDYNGDGWLDLYVANDANPNQLWINQRNGTFVDDGALSGSAVNAAGNPEGSMGIASGDFDADGDEDLFITNIVGETFALYVNDGKGGFEDARVRTGVARPTAPMTGFGTDWIDYDNDGWLDLFIANGAVNIVERLRGQPFPFQMRNQLLRNTHDGRFEDMTDRAGPAFARLDVARGAAFGDVDNDGDVDVLVTNNNAPARLLLNQLPAGSHWLAVSLKQPGANLRAVGARIGVARQGQSTLWRRVRSDGSYLTANDLRVHVGLGRSASIAAVVVEWPDGTRERWTDVRPDRAIVLTRGTGTR